jgi:hypothetical protein
MMPTLLLIKVGVVLVLLAAVAWGAHRWLESVREEGRLEIRLEWAEALEAQKVLEAKNAEETRTRLLSQEVDRAKQFAALRNRNRALESKLAVACVDPTLIAGMRDSVRTANRQSPGGTTPDSTVAAGTPDGNQVNNWFADVTELYTKCRDQVIAWVEWDNRRVGAK